jgi:hypothetical protein
MSLHLDALVISELLHAASVVAVGAFLTWGMCRVRWFERIESEE